MKLTSSPRGILASGTAPNSADYALIWQNKYDLQVNITLTGKDASRLTRGSVTNFGSFQSGQGFFMKQSIEGPGCGYAKAPIVTPSNVPTHTPTPKKLPNIHFQFLGKTTQTDHSGHYHYVTWTYFISPSPLVKLVGNYFSELSICERIALGNYDLSPVPFPHTHSHSLILSLTLTFFVLSFGSLSHPSTSRKITNNLCSSLSSLSTQCTQVTMLIWVKPAISPAIQNIQ